MNVQKTTSGPVSEHFVTRIARGCLACRAKKMRCVGLDDTAVACERCKQQNIVCVFEKHRHTRKPGSKLSEASKMLRRLEKGLVNGQRRSMTQTKSGGPSTPTTTTQHPTGHPRALEVDEETDDEDSSVFTAQVIHKESKRNHFLRTILNPVDDNAHARRLQPSDAYTIPDDVRDPITAGYITEDDANTLFDAMFIRLNPFINLFDPTLHTVRYVRSKSSFLFSVLIACGCRFFKTEVFKQCQQMAQEFAIQAFAEQSKSIEVCQAFACLIYWRDPDDNRTWTYIGYACRMAVELNLNQVSPAGPPRHETDLQFLERRNRERTYLVLFIHDRSLSTQTGKIWMLPEDDLVRSVHHWHECGGGSRRPEDVIVAAFTTLRHITAETTETFRDSRTRSGHSDMKYEVVLQNCNGKLTRWMEHWTGEMQRAGGQTFHFSFLSFFRLYDRLFLNSFGIQYCSSKPSETAVTACYTSATEALRILAKDFALLSMLRYCQDSVITMSAYAAVFLLKLLRSSLLPRLKESAREIYSLIIETADAFEAASSVSPASEHTSFHARFLRGLLHNGLFTPTSPPPPPPLPASRPGRNGFQSYTQQTTPLSDDIQNGYAPPAPAVQYPPQPAFQYQQHDVIARYAPGPVAPLPPPPPGAQEELDVQYWRNMFMTLGFGGHGDNPNPMAAIMTQPQTVYDNESGEQVQQQEMRMQSGRMQGGMQNTSGGGYTNGFVVYER